MSVSYIAVTVGAVKIEQVSSTHSLIKASQLNGYYHGSRASKVYKAH